MRLQLAKKLQASAGPIRFAEEVCKRFARKMGLPWRVRLYVRVSKNWSGRAWGSRGRGYAVCYLPVRRIDPFIHVDRRYKDTDAYLLLSHDEVAIFLVAHELGHLIGYDGDRAGEVACDRLGYQAVRAWRDRQYQSPECLI